MAVKSHHDEEHGFQGNEIPSKYSNNGNDWDDSKLQEMEHRISDISASEFRDHISEITPLVSSGKVGVKTPSYSSHGRASLKRISSDDSILSVTALKGMKIRAHSIRSKTKRGENVCIIRPSTTRDALRAVKLERIAAEEMERDETSNSVKADMQQPTEATDFTKSNAKRFALSTQGCYWIDIEAPQSSSSDDLSDFLQQLMLPPFLISILSEPQNWSTEVIALRDVSLAMLQILPADPESDEITHAALLSMPQLLVTFSTCHKMNELEGLYIMVSKYMQQRGRVPEPSNTGALLAWMQYHVQRTSKALQILRTAALEMDEALDRDFESFDFEDLVEAKNCLLRVRSVAEEQHGTIEALVGAEHDSRGLNFTSCRSSLSVLLATAASNERLSSRLDGNLNEFRERILQHRKDSLDQRMGLLTILSSIFMPLTLLTGIWGMNFENMPELSEQNAYQGVLFGMFLLALCMVGSFYRTGWSN